jgi:hypothetical protein
MINKKMETLAMPLSIANFKSLCKLFSPEIPVMVRGRHAIGKTEAVRQVADELRDDFYKNPENCRRMAAALSSEKEVAKKLAKNNGVWTYEMGIPIIERRLSQLQEGDIIGLPFSNGQGTEFRPVTWLLHCAEFPVLLFLDELNRATKQIEQATFQLADSKAFYGKTLHEGTRLYVAVNIGDSYQVEDFDPAALSRYAVIDLEPTTTEFLEYIRNTCNSTLYNFLKINPDAIEDKETPQPNKKTPDRRAWKRLDTELTKSGLYKNPFKKEFLFMAGSMVGFNYGNLFWEFAKQQENLTGEDIILQWSTLKENLPEDNEMRIAKITSWSIKVSEYFRTTSISEEYAKIIGPKLNTFLSEIPYEIGASIYPALSEKETNIFYLSGYISQTVAKIFTSNRDRNTNTLEEIKKTSPIIPRQRK